MAPELFKFDFDIVHRVGIKHQAAGVLLQLSMSGKDERQLEDDLPLYTINNLDKPPVSEHTVAQDKDYARRVQNAKPSDEEL